MTPITMVFGVLIAMSCFMIGRKVGVQEAVREVKRQTKDLCATFDDTVSQMTDNNKIVANIIDELNGLRSAMGEVDMALKNGDIKTAEEVIGSVKSRNIESVKPNE